MWASSGPPDVKNTSLSLYLNTTYPTLISKQQTALVRDPFFADYASVHDGRKPFIDPAAATRWAWGDALPAGALESAIDEKTNFMNWFNTEVLPPVDDPTQCSSGLLLYCSAGSAGVPYTRNTYLDPPGIPYGFSGGSVSIFAEVPDHVFPIGQVPSHSNVTGHVEYLPVSVDIVAAKGCDGMLVRLAQDLVRAGVLKTPSVGQTIYGGDVLFKRNADAAGLERVRYVG